MVLWPCWCLYVHIMMLRPFYKTRDIGREPELDLPSSRNFLSRLSPFRGFSIYRVDILSWHALVAAQVD